MRQVTIAQVAEIAEPLWYWVGFATGVLFAWSLMRLRGLRHERTHEQRMDDAIASARREMDEWATQQGLPPLRSLRSARDDHVLVGDITERIAARMQRNGRQR